MKIRCDRCGKEFNGDELLMDSLDEVICPDCREDADEDEGLQPCRIDDNDFI
jgi:hypothetical protein